MEYIINKQTHRGREKADGCQSRRGGEMEFLKSCVVFQGSNNDNHAELKQKQKK